MNDFPNLAHSITQIKTKITGIIVLIILISATLTRPPPQVF